MKILDYLKRPVIAALVGGVLGLILGLIWAWLIQPIVWKNVPPAQLGTYYQEQYLRMAIDSYRVNPDDALAHQRYQALGLVGLSVLETIENNPGNQDANAILNFADVVQQVAATPTPAAGGQTPAKTGSWAIYTIILGAVVLFAVIGFGIFRYLIPLVRNKVSASPTAPVQASDISSQPAMTNYEAIGEEPPISQFVTTYVLGDDLFDDSFSIDSPSGEFLGECGIGISETIGVGEPKKVQAFEVWLFDKNDIQTVTKVLMSSHAFNDGANFQRLQAKGEPIMVERGKQIILETAALQLVATVSDMEYGQGALPQDSYFDRLTLEIAVWPKVVALA
jgi:hypothetical protein